GGCGVACTLLSPRAGGQGSDNNGSCVLLARLGGLAILLPGDIERAVEERLVVTWRDAPGDGIDLLLAPHHGSKTSSSPAFIRWARPRHPVFPAGFRHHSRHPHPAVEARLVVTWRDAPGDGIDLLLAPHHGSKTSSSTAFIRWARARHTVFSAGFRQHFGHPHPAVVARYREAGGALWYSAASGALVFRWDGEGRGPEVVEHRLRPW